MNINYIQKDKNTSLSRRMKNLTYSFALLSTIVYGMTFTAKAQDLSSVLSEIEKNNTELQALRKRTEAEKYEVKTERGLEAPEVGFDYLWGSPAEIGNRKDVSITQTIDIATISGTRWKLAASKSRLLDNQYDALRQRVLLEGKVLCIKLVYCNSLSEELAKRLERAESVDKFYKELLLRGESDMIEANKAHLSYLAQKNAYARNEVERDELVSELRRLNGGQPFEFFNSEYDDTMLLPADFDVWYQEASGNCPELAFARQNVKVSGFEARNIKFANYPSLTAGYMAELVKGSNFRGLTFGISIPLWSIKSKTRQANLTYEASKLEENNVSEQMYIKMKTLYEKTSGLKAVSDELSSSLAISEEALQLTEKKFEAGEISLLDNILELGLYYDLIDESLAAKRDYYLALAELRAWEL